MAKYDILPSKDMQKVKKDLTDIKKTLKTKKISPKKRRTLKVLPYNDVVEVKQDLKDIKKTLTRNSAAGSTRRKLGNVTRFDNYYDMLPHQTVKELENQLTNLKTKLKNKRDKTAEKKRRSKLPFATRQLLSTMNRLNSSITSMIQLLEKADELMKAPESAPVTINTPSSVPATIDLGPIAGELSEVKARLEELSIENEEMAKGILVIAEMLKEMPSMKKPEAPEKQIDPAQLLSPAPSATQIPQEQHSQAETSSMGSAFERFYQQPGLPQPPTKEALDRKRSGQY